MRPIVSSFRLALLHNVKFREALLGGAVVSLLMLFFGYSQVNGKISVQSLVPYVGSWFAISCILILSVVSAPIIFLVYDIAPLLAFLSRFSRFRPWHFYVGLFLAFLLGTCAIFIITYFLGYVLMYILDRTIILDYIANWYMLAPCLVALTFIEYAFNVLLAAIARVTRGKLLIVLVNLSFIIVLIIANLQAMGIISGNLVYLVPFSSIIALLIQSAVGKPVTIPGLRIELTNVNPLLLMLSTVAWGIIMLTISTILIKICKTYTTE